MAIRNLTHYERPFSVRLRNKEELPYSLTAFQEDMNRMLSHLVKGAEVHATDWDGICSGAPNIDLLEKDDEFILKADLAGLQPEDVEVEMRGRHLTILGKENKESEEKRKDGTYLCRELSCGFFQRTISLPSTADCEKAEADYRNGILCITIPKMAEAVQKPKKIQIKKAS